MPRPRERSDDVSGFSIANEVIASSNQHKMSTVRGLRSPAFRQGRSNQDSHDGLSPTESSERHRLLDGARRGDKALIDELYIRYRLRLILATDTKSLTRPAAG